FRSVNFYVGSDAASTVDGTGRVGELDLAVGIALRAVRRVVEVVVHGDARVVALNQATAGGVVVICGQGESGVVRQRIHGLHEPFAKCGFAGDQGPVVILQC